MEKYQQELIKNVKKYRAARMLSQAQFAELCNVSTGTIGNIECGVAKPSFDLLVTMADVLGIPPSVLLAETPKSATEKIEAEEEHLILLEILIFRLPKVNL